LTFAFTASRRPNTVSPRQRPGTVPPHDASRRGNAGATRAREPEAHQPQQLAQNERRTTLARAVKRV
jgi:hypothetical protein